MFVVDSLLCFGGKTWYNAVRSSALMSVSEVRAIFLVEALKLLTPYFTPKIFISHTRFQTWPLKSIPVFRPEGQSMSNSNITLSFLFIWN